MLLDRKSRVGRGVHLICTLRCSCGDTKALGSNRLLQNHQDSEGLHQTWVWSQLVPFPFHISVLKQGSSPLFPTLHACLELAVVGPVLCAVCCVLGWIRC